jgi:hypothetical protein
MERVPISFYLIQQIGSENQPSMSRCPIYSIQKSLQIIQEHKKLFLVSIIIAALALNIVMFCYAYPDITKLEFGDTARDFSAYYMGAWRLFNNPTMVYHDGGLPTDYPLAGIPQPFKYPPSFLLLIIPFLAVNYMDALVTFTFLQLALIPLLAFFVYKLIKDKNPILGAIAAFIVLVQPLPTPASNIPFTEQIHLWNFNINVQSFSPSYYCGYVYINAHILQAILLVGALYFGYSKKPWFSALLFAFGLMDPRAAIFSVPLLLWYNRSKLREFLAGSAIFILATNLPFFFYSDVGVTFLQTVLHAEIIAQSYAYDWIPSYSVIALSLIELITVLHNRHKNGSAKQ